MNTNRNKAVKSMATNTPQLTRHTKLLQVKYIFGIFSLNKSLILILFVHKWVFNCAEKVNSFGHIIYYIVVL